MATAYSSGRVAPVQRFTRNSPCPVCGGWQGHGDWGFYSDDGRYAFCTAEAFAGALSLHPTAQAYKHLLEGACRCGVEHGGALSPDDWCERIPEATAPRYSHHEKTPTAIYDKYDNSNVRKLRYPVLNPKPGGRTKYFLWQHADGQGDWANGLEGQAPGLYNGAALATADPFALVYITEGEKDAEKIIAAGGVAVSPPGGVGSWEEEYSERLRGFMVVVCGDRDAHGKGQAHAQHVAESCAAHGAIARVILFDDAKDVAEWLSKGHTLDELRAMAAQTPIITAPLPQSRIGPVTLQDEMSPQTPESCPNCRQWRDRARIAETTVQHLRAERVVEDKYLAIPNEKLSAPVKLAAIALRRELNEQQHNPLAERDEERRPRIYRAAIARRTGTKEAAAGGSLQKVAAAQLFERREKRSADDTKTFYAPGPHFNQPEAIAEPERANTWGGKRVKVCVACGSDNLETRVICRECGTVQSAVDTNKPEPPDDTPDGPQSRIGPVTLQDDATYADVCEEEEETQAQAQEYPPFANTTVRNLASDAGASDVLALAEACGWPALQIGPMTPMGERGWASVMRAATPDQIQTARCALVTQHQAALSGGAKE